MYKKINLLFLILFLILIGCGSGSGGGGGDEPSCVVVNGPGAPEIHFTTIPDYGSFENVQGVVSHVLAADYKVAAYIRVGGLWNKPTFDNPKTDINCDGTFTVDITTGGADHTATEIRLYLIPAAYDPPLVSGGQLPAEIEDNMVASVIAVR